MYCTKCGAEVAADAKFCVKCGVAIGIASSANELPIQEPEWKVDVFGTATEVTKGNWAELIGKAENGDGAIVFFYDGTSISDQNYLAYLNVVLKNASVQFPRSLEMFKFNLDSDRKWIGKVLKKIFSQNAVEHRGFFISCEKKAFLVLEAAFASKETFALNLVSAFASLGKPVALNSELANLAEQAPKEAYAPEKKKRPSLVMIVGGGFIALCVLFGLYGTLTGQGPGKGGSTGGARPSEQAKFESDAMSLAKKLHSTDGGTRENEQARADVEKLLSTYKNKAVTGWACKMFYPGWTRGDKKYDVDVSGCNQIDYESDPKTIRSDKFDYSIKIPAESTQPAGSKIYRGDTVIFSGVIEKVELHKGFGGALYTGVGYEVKVLNGTINEIKPK